MGSPSTRGAFTLGLTFDLELGNLVKATRFGYVVRAQHGNELLGFDEQRRSYYGTVIDLREERFEFMNTLFELSRASLWCQLVDLHDRRPPLPGIAGYAHLYRAIDEALGTVHVDGSLKAAIEADPERFVDLDPGIITTLQDQRLAGKELLLITNAEWSYTRHMMSWCFDDLLPDGTTWRDLFDLVIVAAAKPRFFAEAGADLPHRRSRTRPARAPRRGARGRRGLPRRQCPDGRGDARPRPVAVPLRGRPSVRGRARHQGRTPGGEPHSLPASSKTRSSRPPPSRPTTRSSGRR